MSESLHYFSERIADAARELQDQHDPDATMKTAVALLVDNVDGCDAAGISIVHAKRRVDTPAATDEIAVTADRLQYELGEGPCLDAVWEHEVVYAPDLARDARWPTWGPRVTQATIARSALCFRLFTMAHTVGALNMYSTRLDGFDEHDKAEGRALAAHIAIAVTAAQQVEQLDAALDSRTVIAQACGMMMERFHIDAPRAFALLTRLSSHQNVKLREVALQIVTSREVPKAPGS